MNAMNYSRTIYCRKYLFELRRVSASMLNNLRNYRDFIWSSSSSCRISHINKLQSKYNIDRNFYRLRYSFVYSKPAFSVTNSKLSTLNNNKFSGAKAIVDENPREENPLTKSQAVELVLRLTEEERKYLMTALSEYESNQVKAEYEGQLAAARWRSKFGRPSKLPTLGDVDPTGSYCHLSEDWLKKKYAEQVPMPSAHQLLRVAVFNAVPFVGFGFLDNFIMIVAGDYIDETVGSIVTISTMAAAALGNTISDVMGIGSAWYVELAASRIGLKAPNLSPIQLDMKPARRAANLGRAVGIIIGCLLGMIPLLFIKKEENKSLPHKI